MAYCSWLLYQITQNDTKAERPTRTKAPGFRRSAPLINPAPPEPVPFVVEFPIVVDAVVVVTVVVVTVVVFVVVSLLARKLSAFTWNMATKNKSQSRSPGFKPPAPAINPAAAVPFCVEFLPSVVVAPVVVTVVVVTVVVVTVVVFVVVSLLAKNPSALTSSTAAATKSKRATMAFDMAGLS